MYLNKQIDYITYYKLCYVLNKIYWYKLLPVIVFDYKIKKLKWKIK